MTTYTMNGHSHPTTQVQSEILMGMVGNQVAKLTRAQWQFRALPERFKCLESADPQIQLQTALNQIERLLHKNTQLLESVLLLSRALNDAHSLIDMNESISRLDRDKLKLSHDFQVCIRQLRSGEVSL